MRLLVHHNYDISSFSVRMFIRLTMEDVFFTMRGTFIYVCFENFFLFDNFLSIAVFAFVSLINDLTSSSAFITRSGRLRVHSWTYHSHLCFHSSSIAAFAS